MDKPKNNYDADILALVKLVEERPCIWDKACVKEPGERKRAWREICENLFPCFEDMEAEEQTKLEHYLSGKWQNLRDTFTRLSKKKCETRYRYYEILKFLVKNLDLKPKPSSSAIQPAAQTNENSAFLPPKRFKRIASSSLRINVNHKRKRLSINPRTVKVVSPAPDPKSVKLELSPLTTTDANSVKPEQESYREDDTLDEDEAFFISIMPNIKRFSDEEKIEFRMAVLGAIKELHQKSRIRNSLSNSPCTGLLFVTEDEELNSPVPMIENQ